MTSQENTPGHAARDLSKPDASWVLVAARVPATPERAFAAFTEEIGSWWRPNNLFRFSRRSTGTLSFDPGPQGRLVERYPDGSEFVVGEIRLWDPPSRLALSWRQEGFPDGQVTELHVQFEPVPGGETRVTVEHFGWDRIPPENATRHGFPLAVFQLRFAEWWRLLLDELGLIIGTDEDI